MKCSQCGYELSAESKFCPVCGSKVNDIQNINIPSNNPKPYKSKKTIFIILILALLLIIAGTTTVYFLISSYTGDTQESVTEIVSDTTVEEKEIIADEIDISDEKEGIVEITTDKNALEAAAKQVPVTSASSSSPASGTKSGSKKSHYIQKANEIESHAEQLARSASSQADLNAVAYETFSEWDELLNDVYQYLKSTLPTSEFEALKKDEAAWINKKEAAMEEERQVWSGGSAETMSVFGVATQYTQERCYYLISLID